jgi:hypothetical protein
MLRQHRLWELVWYGQTPEERLRHLLMLAGVYMLQAGVVGKK